MNKISTFFIPLIWAAFSETELSNAIGPNTSASIPSFFALLVNSEASIELGTLSKISSVAERREILGFFILQYFPSLANIG